MKSNSPAIEAELARLGTVFFPMETSGTGVDLYRRARNRMRNRMRRARRQQRRYQTLVADVHHAFGTLAQLRQPYADGLVRQYKLGIIWHRELRRDIAKLYIVRARLGR